jgi:hypothetical protein
LRPLLLIWLPVFCYWVGFFSTVLMMKRDILST